MEEKIKLFLNEYKQLDNVWFEAKKQGNVELAKIAEAKKLTLAWVLVELGYKKEVNDINQGVWVENK